MMLHVKKNLDIVFLVAFSIAKTEQVYSKLKGNKIYYNDDKNTSLLNVAIITKEKF